MLEDGKRERGVNRYLKDSGVNHKGWGGGTSTSGGGVYPSANYGILLHDTLQLFLKFI